MTGSLLFALIASSLTFAATSTENYESPPVQRANYCLLPPYPEHGQYIVTGYPNAKPGDRYPNVLLTVSCDTGYQIENNNTNVFCVKGLWSTSIPQCIRCCTLMENLSVEYRCELSGPGSVNGSRECDSSVPSGTVVTPICRAPAYFSLRALNKMHCIDGIWNNEPICKPACGITTQHRHLEGSSTDHLELPWHTVIYTKRSKTYQQSCGGSLISSKVIISAAHCFWKMLPVSNYLVAVGKLYRPYTDPRDQNSQHSNVTDIKLSPSYNGPETNYQDDIAIVVVETSFFFFRSVRPVCLDFDYSFDGTQPTEGNSGKLALWNTGGEKSQLPPVLKVFDFPYINDGDCFLIVPNQFRKYKTSDKFCAGSNNGSLVCGGNSGGGLAFLEPTTQRYYLSGVLSVGINGNEERCATVNAFTSILKHENLIKQYI